MLNNKKVRSSAGRVQREHGKSGDQKTSKPAVEKSVNFDTTEEIAKLLSIGTEALYRMVLEEESGQPWHR
ncbi:MAG: hypothetical protein ACLQU2_11120 [Candidatus Binataceae bacterium]